MAFPIVGFSRETVVSEDSAARRKESHGADGGSEVAEPHESFLTENSGTEVAPCAHGPLFKKQNSLESP